MNPVSKKDFFNDGRIRASYEPWSKGMYKLKKGALGIGRAVYLQWDHLHNDVEAWCRNRSHLGSIDPLTHRFYRAADLTRRFPG